MGICEAMQTGVKVPDDPLMNLPLIYWKEQKMKSEEAKRRAADLQRNMNTFLSLGNAVWGLLQRCLGVWD